MSSTLTEALKAQKYWNEQYDLPIWSGNPHVVLATYCRLESGFSIPDALKVDGWLHACQAMLGLFYRWPGKPEPNTSHDELIAIAAMSPDDAFRILLFCQAHDWIYDSVTPESGNMRWYLGRFIFFPPYLKAAAGVKVNLLSQAIWAAYAVKTALKKDLTDTSTRILFWLMLPAVQPYWLMRIGSLGFKKIMQEKYPGGLSELLGIYYGKEHPFSVYAPKDFN